MTNAQDFFKPQNDSIVKATAMTEGRRSDYLNHMKSMAHSLAALAWVAFIRKDDGMPNNTCRTKLAHVKRHEKSCTRRWHPPPYARAWRGRTLLLEPAYPEECRFSFSYSSFRGQVQQGSWRKRKCERCFQRPYQV